MRGRHVFESIEQALEQVEMVGYQIGKGLCRLTDAVDAPTGAQNAYRRIRDYANVKVLVASI